MLSDQHYLYKKTKKIPLTQRDKGQKKCLSWYSAESQQTAGAGEQKHTVPPDDW